MRCDDSGGGYLALCVRAGFCGRGGVRLFDSYLFIRKCICRGVERGKSLTTVGGVLQEKMKKNSIRDEGSLRSRTVHCED